MQALRYQYGNLTVRERKKGSDVWQFRWAENGKPKSMLIGTVEKLPTKADAERAVEHLRSRINANNPQSQFHSITVGGLIDRFMAEYAPKRCRLKTLRNYRSVFKNHIRPRWADEFIEDVRTAAVQDWLDAYPHSRQVKVHVRRLLHTLFEAAIFWEMLRHNPIALVRQSGKRLKKPRALTATEFRLLVAELPQPWRTMILVVACFGLRVSELLGLKWGDVNFKNLTIRVERSTVEGEVNETKTETSEGDLPLDPALAEALLAHRARSVYVSDSDFVFAGREGGVRWKDSILEDHIKPAAERAGIGKVGWHTFRHTYSTLLGSLATDIKVQQELLRHSNIQTTMNVYTQAVTPKKREAASRVVHALYESVLVGKAPPAASC